MENTDDNSINKCKINNSNWVVFTSFLINDSNKIKSIFFLFILFDYNFPVKLLLLPRKIRLFK